jgi:hypothetical protein
MSINGDALLSHSLSAFNVSRKYSVSTQKKNIAVKVVNVTAIFILKNLTGAIIVTAFKLKSALNSRIPTSIYICYEDEQEDFFNPA